MPNEPLPLDFAKALVAVSPPPIRGFAMYVPPGATVTIGSALPGGSAADVTLGAIDPMTGESSIPPNRGTEKTRG